MNKKILALVIIILIVLTATIIVVSLNNKNEEKDKEANKPVDIIYSLVADKTEVKPGDTLEVKFTLDKLPDNGYGVGAMNIRIAFDSSKLTLEKTTNDFDETVDYIVPGVIGEEFGIGYDSPRVKETENSSEMVISLAAAKSSVNAVKNTGEIFTIKFKVNDDATGNVGLHIVKLEDGKYDFATSGVIKDELGRKGVDTNSTYDINTNVEQVTLQ